MATKEYAELEWPIAILLAIVWVTYAVVFFGTIVKRKPIRQRGVVQVVRAGPDVQGDQRPEVHDGQPVRVNRTFGLFGHEVVHHPQETVGQEKTDRVVAGHLLLCRAANLPDATDLTPSPMPRIPQTTVMMANWRTTL